jgi:hypothetical protein
MATQQHRPRAEAGLTLIETIFALAVFAFGFLALFGPIHYATLSQVNSREMAAAVEVATTRMEQIKIGAEAFFAQVPPAQLPPSELTGRWHHSLLDLDFGEVPGHPNFACYVVLERNVMVGPTTADPVSVNVAIVRVAVVWRRVGGAFSTLTGGPYDPANPDRNPATVELRTIVRYR